MAKFIASEIVNGIGIIKLNNPEKRNALTPELITEFLSELKKFEADANVLGIIITGEGTAFCAGADLSYLKKLQSFSLLENEKDSSQISEIFLALYECNKITVAAVNGHAIAGGCGLALACDYILSNEKASFGFTEVKIGFIPAIISFLVLKRLPEAKARQLLISGDILSSKDAITLGLIDAIVDDPVNAAKELIEKLFANSRSSITETKK